MSWVIGEGHKFVKNIRNLLSAERVDDGRDP